MWSPTQSSHFTMVQTDTVEDIIPVMTRDNCYEILTCVVYCSRRDVLDKVKEDNPAYVDELSASLMITTATYNKKDMLDWFLEKGYPKPMCMYEVATKSSNYSLLKWLHEKEFPIHPTDDRSVMYASEGGRIDQLKWLLERNFTPDLALELAAGGNQFKTIRWLYHVKNYPLTSDVFMSAATTGDIKMCRWLQNQNCPYNDTVCQAAIIYNKYDLLKWLHAKGHIINDRCFLIALRNGDLRILNYLYETTCYKGSIKARSSYLFEGSNVNTFHWYFNKGFTLEFYPDWIKDIEEEDKKLDILVFLHKSKCEERQEYQELMKQLAFKERKLEVLAYLSQFTEIDSLERLCVEEFFRYTQPLQELNDINLFWKILSY